MFKTYDELVAYINSFDGIKYGKTRNYINGGVSRLSPYITHGVITTKEVITLFLQRYTVQQAEMLFKELLWREYFVQVHYRKRDGIFSDIEEDKTNIRKHDLLPSSLLNKTTQSKWVNQAILELEQTGYLHNHIRMWLASYCVHYGKLYWKKCADWTYYHFLDGELGSNHLSRQWVQSTFSHKPYFMNEENIIRYRPSQTEPALRDTYEDVEKMLFDDKRVSPFAHDSDVCVTLVTDLSHIANFDAATWGQDSITILTPRDWHPTKCTKPENTICIFDERFFATHPRSTKRIAFIEKYAKHYGITIYKGNLDTILSALHQMNKKISLYETRNPFYREAYEHAIQLGATCIAHERASPLVIKGYTKKFFPFWEKSAPHLYTLQRLLGKHQAENQ